MTSNQGPWNTDFAGYFVSVATYVMTLIIGAILLRSRRTPASTIAWLVIIAFAPYVGIPLFFLIGGRKMGRKAAPPKAPIYARVPYGQTASSLSRIQRVLRSVGAPEPAPNREIQFLTSGEAAYSALIDEIRGAHRSIDLEMFILKRDECGTAVLRELALKASQGVRVRLLLDALGSNALIRPSLRKFREAGGHVAYFMPLLHLPFKGRTNLRNHRKLATFDGRSAWFGGMNIANEYLGPRPVEERWVDLAIHLRGNSVAQLQAVFDLDWAFARGETPPPMASEVSPGRGAEPDTHLVQVVASGPDVPGDSLYEGLLEACFDARSRIWIATPYFVPDDSLIKALELACRRNVDVRLLMPAKSNHFFADLSRGSYVRQLTEAGGKIYLLPKMSHAKLILIDDSFVLAGSANFDLRSLLYNYEVGAFLSSEPEISAAERWFTEVFQSARLGYPPATFWRSLIEGVGRIFGPLL